MHELIVEGATIVDGSGAASFVGSVGVRGSRIAWIRRSESADDLETEHRLDGRGAVLTPGFVDVHNHSDLSPLVDPDMVSTVRQGVTTVVVGNCGSSPWPPAGARECVLMAGGDPEAMHPRSPRSATTWIASRRRGRRSTWPRSSATARFASRPCVGATGPLARGADRDVRGGGRGRAAGRGGAVHGLDYVPGLYSVTDEVVALAEAAGAEGGLYASHIRGEGAHLFRAVDEAIENGRRAGVPAHVSHLKCESSVAWGRTSELLDRFHGDDDVTADQYPYAAWASELWSLLPPWAPIAEIAALRANPATCSRLADGIEHGEGDTFQSSVDGVDGRIVIESCGDGRWNGRSVQAIAQSRSIEPVDACLDLLEADPDTSCIGHAMDEDDVRAIVSDVDVMVASDAIAMSPDGPLGGVPVHPRNYGTFPRVLGRYVREGAIGLEAAVRTMTSLPANRFGLVDRGRTSWREPGPTWCCWIPPR